MTETRSEYISRVLDEVGVKSMITFKVGFLVIAYFASEIACMVFESYVASMVSDDTDDARFRIWLIGMATISFLELFFLKHFGERIGYIMDVWFVYGAWLCLFELPVSDFAFYVRMDFMMRIIHSIIKFNMADVIMEVVVVALASKR